MAKLTGIHRLGPIGYALDTTRGAASYFSSVACRVFRSKVSRDIRLRR
jgi:hypothetical protein